MKVSVVNRKERGLADYMDLLNKYDCKIVSTDENKIICVEINVHNIKEIFKLNDEFKRLNEIDCKKHGYIAEYFDITLHGENYYGYNNSYFLEICDEFDF